MEKIFGDKWSLNIIHDCQASDKMVNDWAKSHGWKMRTSLKGNGF